MLIIPPHPSLPARGEQAAWGSLLGASLALAVAELAQHVERPLLVLAEDARHADQLEAEVRFFGGTDLPVEHFVEWETLPWDTFSPHQDIISQRLRVLSKLAGLRRGVVIAAATALHQRLPPVSYVAARSLSLRQSDAVDRNSFIDSLTAAGYLRVPQVGEHGEFAVRGSLIDVFPMGADAPVRIDFFDDEIDSLRWFSADNQISGDHIDGIEVLPAREVPLDQDAIRGFRDRYRERFEGQPSKSRVYREVSDGIAHGGIEYYLPLFFDATASLPDYLPPGCMIIAPAGVMNLLDTFESEARERFALCSLDRERPILGVDETFVSAGTACERLADFPLLRYATQSLASGPRDH